MLSQIPSKTTRVLSVRNRVRLKPSFLIVAMLLQLACSSRFVYNNLDWLAYWYIDDYVGFTSEQRILFDPQVNRLLGWHREKALPEYLDLLSRVHIAVGQADVTPNQVQGWFFEVRDLWKTLVLETEPLFMMAAAKAEGQQIDELLESLKEDLAERREKRLKYTVEQRRARRQERLQESFSKWLGFLSVDQQEQLGVLSSSLRASSEQWINYRTRWVEGLELALLSRQDPDIFDRRMQRLIRAPHTYRSPDHQANLDADRRLWSVHLSQAINGLSDRQRAHLRHKLEDMISDIRYLIGGP